MKKIVLCVLLVAGAAGWLAAQEPAAQQTQQPPQSIGKSLGIYIFPGQGQDQETQDKDEFDCYKWAVNESGIDPMNLPEVQAQEVPGGMGAAGAVGGAARGAAAGAIIGAISGDAGKGAAIGAAAGGMGGMRAGRTARARAQQQSQAQARQQEQNMLNEFKKAFSVCMEAKGYTVK